MNRNVALLVLDTVRKDHFDRYAPRLQDLGDVSFDRCYAASSWSTPSHASMFTGELAHRHGVHAHNLDFSTLSTAETFLSEFPGHRTVGTSTNLFAGPSFGFDSLFDEFPSVSRHGVLPGGVNIERFHEHSESAGVGQYLAFLREARSQNALLPSLVNGAAVKVNDLVESLPVARLWDYGASAIVRGARDWLAPGDRPFFFFANFMEAHSPYEPCRPFDGDICDVPAGWRDGVDEWEINSSADPIEEFGDEIEARRRVYAGAIDYLDRTITPFVRDLLERTDRETTVVITADHGENLCYPADGGYWGHVGSLSNALLHVPLVVVNPPEGFDPDVSEPFSHLDLGSLLAGFGHDEGRRFVRDSVPAERVGLGVADDVEDFEFWDRGLRCVYEGEDRREWDTLGGSARFHVDGPSSETRVETDVPIPDGDEDHFDEPLAAFKRRASQAQRSVDIADSTEDSLRELGYL